MMKFILTMALISFLMHFSILHKYTSSISIELNNICNEKIKSDFETKNLLQALICGNSIKDQTIKNTLNKTNLIHIFVVSGAHLVFLEQIISLLPFSIRVIILLLYSLMTLAQPPVIRALAQLFLEKANRKQGYNLKPWQYSFWSVFLVLTLNWEWILSRSLIMSGLASLAMSITSANNSPPSRNTILWKKLLYELIHITKLSFLIYLFMFPCLMDIQNNHPIGILFNIIFTPFISLFIFPLSLFAYFFNFLIPIFNYVLKHLIQLLAFVSNSIPSQPVFIGRISIVLLWFEFLILGIGIHYFKRNQLRNKDYI